MITRQETNDKKQSNGGDCSLLSVANFAALNSILTWPRADHGVTYRESKRTAVMAAK